MPSNRTAVMETSKGQVRLELYESEVPLTVMNFVRLSEDGFYDGLTFHRYVPGFVIQGGDPLGNGTGGSGRKIKLETHPDLKHEKGAVAMARAQNPDSASSQFYITLAPQPSLDGQYAVFGKVVSGMDVVDELREGDTITQIRITD